MAIDTASPRSRRALLAATLGAGVATVASALGRPLPARAVDGEAVLVGGSYAASSATRFATGSTGALALWGASGSNTGVLGSSTAGEGVRGSSVTASGVYGFSSSGIGVYGFGPAGTGVFGQGSSSGIGVSGESVNSVGVRGKSTASYGVQGITSTGSAVRGESTGGGYGIRGSSSKVAVFGDGEVGVEGLGDRAGVAGNGGNIGIGVEGRNFGATQPATVGWAGGHAAGVFGYSNDGSGNMPIPPAKTGVFGYAIQDANARGVTGQTTAGRGVNGIATTGTAGYFATSDPKKGYALRAVGRVKLDKCAGVATIGAGGTSVLVTPGIDLTSSSAVVATLQGNAGAVTTTVSRCFINATANTFTIYLTAKATQSVKVAWHVFG